MPGIFAPTLPEGGTAIQPLGAVQDNTLSNAVRQVGGIFESLISSGRGGGGGGTLAERHQDELREVARRYSELQQQRDQLGVQYRSVVDRETRGFLTQFPHLRQEIFGLASGVAEIDVEEPLDTPVDAVRNDIQRWLQTPEGAVGASIAVGRSFVDGRLDNNILWENTQALWFEQRSREHNVIQMKQRVDLAEGDAKLRDLAADEGALALLPDQQKRAAELVHGLVSQFKSNFDSGSVTDAGQLLVALTNEIEKIKGLYLAEATSAGVHDSNKYSIDVALSPLTTLRDSIEGNMKNMTTILNSEMARSSLLFNKFIDTVTGIPGSAANKHFIEVVAAEVARNGIANLPELLETAPEYFANQENPWKFDLFGSGAGENPEAPETVTENVNEVITTDDTPNLVNMSDEELASTALGALGLFTFATDDVIRSTDGRAEMVKNYAYSIAASKKLARNGTLDNQSMVRIYNQNFIDKYHRVVEQGDISAQRLTKLVSTHFAETISQRRLAIEDLVRNNTVVRGIQFSLNENGVITMMFDKNDPNLSQAQKDIINASGEVSLDGIIAWQENMRLNDTGEITSPTDLTTGLSAFRDVRDRVNRMNDLVKLNKQFTNLTDSVKKYIEKKFSFQPVDVSRSVFVVTSEEEYNQVPEGAVVQFVEEDGTSHVAVKPRSGQRDLPSINTDSP